MRIEGQWVLFFRSQMAFVESDLAIFGSVHGADRDVEHAVQGVSGDG